MTHNIAHFLQFLRFLQRFYRQISSSNPIV